MFVFLIKDDLEIRKGMCKNQQKLSRVKTFMNKKTNLSCISVFSNKMVKGIAVGNPSNESTNGITEYRWMDKSFSAVFLEFSSKVFTKPKS